MTKKDIDNIISIICPNDEDFEKPIISPAYLKKELEALALEQEPCDDAISREQAIKQCGFGMTSLLIADNLRRLPPITPQQKTGHWIAYEVRLPDRTILNYRCSVCGRKLIGYNTETLSEAPYCHCGAKMDESQESEGEE